MSIFAKSLKTIKSDITGSPLNLKVNVAVWLILDKEYGISQGKWYDTYMNDKNLTSAKFVTAVLRANKHEVTLEEVMENTTEADLDLFINAYNDIVLSDYKEKFPIDEENDKSEVDEGK